MKKLILPVFLLFILSSSCMYIGGKRVRGNGNIRTEEKSVSSFEKVEANGSIDVYISQGDFKPIKIEADENLLKYIEVKEEDGTVIIGNKRGFNLQPTSKIKVYITAPKYRSVSVSGASNIIGQTKITGEESLELDVSGAGDINMDVDAPAVSAEVSGSGTISLKGQTKDLDLGLSGAGNAKCFDMLSENTKVEISGAGSADVYASVKINAEVSGAGSVRYRGNATNVQQQVSGAGSVKKAE